MLKKYRYIMIAAALAIAVVWWLLEGGPVGPPSGHREVGAANIVMTGGRIAEEKDGKKIWEMTAETIEIDSKTGQNTLIGVKGRLYRQAGGAIDIAAGGGTYDPENAEIFLSGGVTAVYSEGWRLKCREIKWDSAKGLISARGDAEFTKDGLLVYGSEIQADRELTKIKVAGGGLRKGK
ncbi:MAG: LPS export ABC transporter periplasmic protein LptC [Acidaminococcales bacterium]|jgi:LPS export ABC transporter protein LptC|nr:LPS export ABC transporter periplasmic protein LptC [Acidaminococcales bacterium]